MIQTNSAGCRGVRPIQATQSGIIRSQARDPLIPAIKFKLGGRVPPPLPSTVMHICRVHPKSENYKERIKLRDSKCSKKKTSATKKLHFAK